MPTTAYRNQTKRRRKLFVLYKKGDNLKSDIFSKVFRISWQSTRHTKDHPLYWGNKKISWEIPYLPNDWIMRIQFISFAKGIFLLESLMNAYINKNPIWVAKNFNLVVNYLLKFKNYPFLLISILERNNLVNFTLIIRFLSSLHSFFFSFSDF